MTSTRSIACAPNCAPMLPPVMVRNAGDDQPPVFLSRTLSTPRPRCPPTTMPPLISDGNTAMPSAFSMIERGTDLSAASMISSSTVDASVMRLASSEVWAVTIFVDAVRASTANRNVFIIKSLSEMQAVKSGLERSVRELKPQLLGVRGHDALSVEEHVGHLAQREMHRECGRLEDRRPPEHAGQRFRKGAIGH